MSIHTDLHPRNAQRRLDYWQALERSLDALTTIADLTGNPPPIASLELRNAFEHAISGNIRLARVQLAAQRTEEISL